MDLVTPHLKTVLKSYQHSATRSLQGPGCGSFFPSNSKLNTKKCLLVRYQNSSSSDDGTNLCDNAAPDVDVGTTSSTTSNTTPSALSTTATITSTTSPTATVTSAAVSTFTTTTSQTEASSSEQKSQITKVKRALGLRFQVPILGK